MLGVALLCAMLSQPVPPPSTEAGARPAGAAQSEYEVYYHHVVRNKTDRELRDVKVYLPVPESDGYQQVEDFRVERSVPVRISNRTDAFGTKMRRVAIVSIPPRGEAQVGFSCVVRLAPPAKAKLDPSGAVAAGALDEVPRPIRDLYLRDHHIFGLRTPEIRETARLLKEQPNPVRRARAIHDLVASTIRYKGGDGWDPAPEVQRRKTGSCSEFTYLFCALCRATGIPTRFVGASIFPAKSAVPFQDHGHHRLAQAYLPGHGWVDFDPTLDAGRPAKQRFVGTHHGRTLVVTRTGDKSQQLGLSYVGANSHGGETTRARWFTWSEGTLARLAEGRKLIEEGKKERGEAVLRELVDRQPGTRAAQEAARILTGAGAEAAAIEADGPEDDGKYAPGDDPP